MRLLDMSITYQIRDGNAEAFENLINEHKSQVFNYCLRMCENHHAAEDLAQDVFLQAYTNINRYDWTKSSLRTWIFVIAHNICLNYLRNNKSRIHTEIAQDFIDERRSPEEQYLYREDMLRLIAALHSLPAEDRELVIMKDYLGFKYREAALVMGVPVGTVKSRLHGIRVKLRRMLEDQNERQ